MRIFGLLLLFVTAATAGVLADAARQLEAPIAVADEAEFDVAPGSSFDSLVRRWQDRQWLDQRTALYVRLYARVKSLAGSIQAGQYRVVPGDTPLSLLEQLVKGEVVQHELTLIEGWRIDQAWAAIRSHPAIRATDGLDSPAELMSQLGHHDLHPEGRLLPETYRFPSGSSDVAFAARAFRAMRAAQQSVWERRQPDLPLENAEQALILASIIERETGLASERRTIAGVFVRRLLKRMRLQTDPTVIYGLGDRFDGNLRRRDLRTDTPYNTYTRHGLPPTPICLPGRASLEAAVDPEPGTALYFVSRGDGSHQFSDTNDEHNAAVREYQLRRRR